MQVITSQGSVPIKAWVGTREDQSPDIEDTALNQLKNLARLPFLHKNGVAVLPDVHAGIGSTVGSVIASRSAIIPAAVSVDIGCGCIAICTSLTADKLPESLTQVRADIEDVVPTGNASHKDGAPFLRSRIMDRSGIPQQVDLLIKSYERTAAQLGTLGGGNHFIEICIDEFERVWVMLHSGSRGIGNKIGSYYIDQAKELCARWHIDLPDSNLAYLPKGDPVFDDYIDAVEWAQQYAMENRKIMLGLVLGAMRKTLPEFTLTNEAISCHHNYIALENHFGENLYITRKGAVRAREDDLGIIPGSMGQKSYIVRGKGNRESYCSCSHGAGRVMSRTDARKRFTFTDLIAQTKGVECRKDEAVVDEIPSAYKDLDRVMMQQADLVEVVATLKAVVCVKGA